MPEPSHPIDSVLGIVLAGGRGTRLGPLTRRLAKPAVPIGGDGHRLIDFTLSNCLNSGLREVGVITQYCSESLTPHLEEVWSRVRGWQSPFVTLLPPPDGVGYQGTADAVYRNIDFIRAHASRHVLVLAGDHLYCMDYRGMLDSHLRSGARVSVGCVEVPVADASGFGVMSVDGQGHIVGFQEKPEHPIPLPGRPHLALASMGIYLFDTATLLGMLESDARDARSSHDFGHDLIPRAVRAGMAYGHSFRDRHDARRQGFWRDVGTLDAYSRAGLEMHEYRLTDDPTWPILHAPASSQPQVWEQLVAA